MTETDALNGATTNAVRRYKKRRMTARVGDDVELPGNAEAVTICDLTPFGASVQISWLEDLAGSDKGVTNRLELREARTRYNDENPIEIPRYATAVSVYEPLDDTESVVYYLC
jgi:hypothetical protein